MSLNITDFRALFPEFSDPVKYPDSLITLYYGVACTFISESSCPCRSLSGESLQMALYYMTAHLMALGTVTSGAAVGDEQGGFVNDATVGEVTVRKQAPPAPDMWSWWMGQTPYGQLLVSLLQVLSVGGLSVGGLPESQGFRRIGGVFL